MKCLDCQHIDMQASPAHTRTGFAPCKVQQMHGVFESMKWERSCIDFIAAPASVIEKRVNWIAKQKGEKS